MVIKINYGVSCLSGVDEFDIICIVLNSCR